MYIDVGGLGIGVYDRLVEQGHGDVVAAINFGGKPVNPTPMDEASNPAAGYANRRAEMWGNLRDALQEGRFRLPDDDGLMADLVSCGYSYQSNGAFLLESKEAMRKRGMPSPDLADACVLCFSQPYGSPAIGRYYVSDGVVVMCDEAGKPTGKSRRLALPATTSARSPHG